ncbi:MAG: YnfA family protein [Pirellulales bacterium]|nr:YnfA family protein [Pirellulales bacterium]
MPDQSLSFIARSVALFVAAGLLEIGGGWLMWKWLREHWAIGWGLTGAVILMLYGVIPTLQQAHFGRVYAVYGGFFIVLSLVWGWALDGNRPDRWDAVGASVAIAGVACMMYAPR